MFALKKQARNIVIFLKICFYFQSKFSNLLIRSDMLNQS